MTKLWTYILLLVVVALLVQDCDAWRRRRRWIRFRLRKAINYYKAYQVAVALGKRDETQASKVYLAENMLNALNKFHTMKETDKKAACAGTTVCGGLCLQEACRWHCDSVCNIIVDNELVWPGELIEMPCTFEEYDSDKDSLISPKELSYMVGEKVDEKDSVVVFQKFDQNGDGALSREEFESGKDHLLIDRASCTK